MNRQYSCDASAVTSAQPDVDYQGIRYRLKCWRAVRLSELVSPVRPCVQLEIVAPPRPRLLKDVGQRPGCQLYNGQLRAYLFAFAIEQSKLLRRSSLSRSSRSASSSSVSVPNRAKRAA